MGRGQLKTAVLVPVKPFGDAKSRLAEVCTQEEREKLARAMLRNVITAAQGMRVTIISPANADDVRRFALINGTRFLTEPEGSGLDEAVQSGVLQLTNSNYQRVVVVHGDIPGVKDLSWLANTEGIIIVPDRSGQGTNAISIPTEIDFRFSYGVNSFQRHINEAKRLGFDPEIVLDPEGLSADVDSPEDFRLLAPLVNYE